MDIAAASTFFDDDPVSDGYTGLQLFTAQVASYDDSASDGATNRRRVLSVGPDVVIPARRVVSLYGERWLVGAGSFDGFQGETVRQHFGMKRATNLMAVLTPVQALAADAGTPAYAHLHYFKDTSDALTSAEYDTFWNVFIAPDEPAARGSFLRSEAGRLYRVRNDYLPVEGLRVCQSDALEPDALRSAVFSTGAYNPVTDAYAAGTTTVNVIAMETAKFYRFRALGDPSVQKGDMAVYVPVSVTLDPNDTFTMAGATWRVLTTQAELGAQVAHVRRA